MYRISSISKLFNIPKSLEKSDFGYRDLTIVNGSINPEALAKPKSRFFRWFGYKYLLIIPMLHLVGCFQTFNDEDAELRTVPVTNNPHIIPNNASDIGFKDSVPY